MKPPTPKRLYVRWVKNNREISVGEYINGKWRNVVEPIHPIDKIALSELKSLIADFKTKTGRDVVLVNYRGSGPAEQLSAEMDKLPR